VTLPTGEGVARQAVLVPGTKTGDARVVSLNAEAVRVLRAWRKVQAEERLAIGAGYADHGLIFCRVHGRPYAPELFSRQFERRIRKPDLDGVQKIRLHDLRHTWATLALEAGVDIAVVSKQLGHSSPTVTWNTYTHVRQAMTTNAAERVAEVLFGAS
jgi:integrase